MNIHSINKRGGKKGKTSIFKFIALCILWVFYRLLPHYLKSPSPCRKLNYILLTFNPSTSLLRLALTSAAASLPESTSDTILLTLTALKRPVVSSCLRCDANVFLSLRRSNSNGAAQRTSAAGRRADWTGHWAALTVLELISYCRITQVMR